ncbi:MAG: RNA-binding protein, partial [Methanobacteriota archaeon]
MVGRGYAPTKRFVLPGDFLGVAEEFLPGEGAYEEKGEILSSVVGVPRVDPKTRKLHVKGVKQPPKPRRGDLVVGRVVEVKNQVVLVELACVVGSEDRGLSPPSLGAIHISKISKRYVENLLSEFQPGDIVLARVVRATRVSVEMTTASPELGVITSWCGRCR